jgi:multicomponent Na+:H+ antiporter subunit A
VLALIAAHGVLAVLAPWLFARLGPRVFLVMALAPAAATAWAASSARDVVAGRPVEQATAWVPGLGLTLDLRLDALGLLMVTLVGGVGTLVLVYCAWYFPGDRQGLGRFAGVLTGFTGAMLGLVLADDLILLYVFWELTSVTSYLLIGHDDEDPESRRAAQQALLVTAFGGLTMLAGFVLLSQAAGTSSLSALLADPPSGGMVPAGLVLVLVGAFTKSAQVPFHPWLPSAMAAPTPVSAYLHAAAMVKAGVYLVARLAPAFAVVPLWRPVVLTVGLATMLVGGWRALRQTDLKRLLAFGTVSQLGFLMVLFGAGTAEAALAGAALLLAHGLFKAALFLSVGVVDHATGTRDMRELSGVGRQLPLVGLAAGSAALSMAGVPLLFGFVSKEAAYEAFLHGSTSDAIVFAGLVAGSVMTAAYSARFVWGAFATKNHLVRNEVHAPSPGLVLPVVLLAGAGLLLGVLPSLADPLVQAYAASYPGPSPEHLALWHGPTAALGWSLVTLALAALLFRSRSAVGRAQRRATRVLSRVDADRSFARVLDAVEVLARRTTAVAQSGSLPVYLGTVLATLVVLPGLALLLTSRVSADLTPWDRPLQPVVGVLIAVAAVAAARARRRFTAVLHLGAVGYGIAVLFVLHGAPDLALTQFLVETLALVIFVFVLRRLPATFVRRPARTSQAVRVGIALAVGAFVTGAVLVSGQARTAAPASQAYLDRSLDEAGGSNVVNVVLVDFRGFDTLGEITVLAVAAMGIASLVLAGRGRGSKVAAGETALTAAGGQATDEPGTSAPEAVR